MTHFRHKWERRNRGTGGRKGAPAWDDDGNSTTPPLAKHKPKWTWREQDEDDTIDEPNVENTTGR